MSDIIPFPQSAEKLKKDINQAERRQDFDRMYELIAQYESQFELDEQLAMTKCRMLYHMDSFLELREETIVLLKRGIQQYDALMIYYVKSLIGLHQYFEAVEVINQIIDEVNNHMTRMELFPLKEYAQSQLIIDEKEMSQMLSEFHLLSARDQTQIILKLMDNGHYQFKNSVINIIENLSLNNNIISLMLEYLRFANSDDDIQINKYDQLLNIVPNKLTGIENTLHTNVIIPEVLLRLEDGALHISDEAQRIMNNHSILLYPIKVDALFKVEDWINAYQYYFKKMIGLECQINNEQILHFIQRLDAND
ncbi:hypothetical protein J3T65_08435 [Staphylococcus simiae]|uniref:hypothetical protein n=1 Tax=Staphylococcus simiae TaxID=308354 RepID=UPI001A96EE95|nr:hypothetical protein [Staphylococcus simiae]MBO1198475.1 hypothetical protein [Staphylococcus simiae]MBO1201709.1 hypothetical protein [Staphylococcus simiae]MBO1203910.1 hypothetical protein [Staphylococcus simiae]MBO1210466.1 hypothetical protein [Staphylococcus simiae]MBO1230142.1 hypothetical protein [Staphylococcus simiae]